MHIVWFYSKKNIFKLSKFEYYRNCFSTLKKEWINIIYFYKEDISIDLKKELIDDIKSTWVDLIRFNKEEEIITYLKNIQWKIFINTFEEQEIIFTNQIKKSLKQKITTNSKLFLNKYLQRNIIGKKYPETIVKYKLLSIKQAKTIEIKKLPPIPFIIKPTWWVQSSWVGKVENSNDYKETLNKTLNALKKLENKNLVNQQILIEEFIDGKMYTIDYYVDEMQNIKISKPVGIKIWFDYWINDFCNISRFISREIEKEIDQKKLKEFITKTVIWWEIRNIFIHHEFKINSKWEFKTIETNWRIGWFRLDMYQIWYGINLLRFPFEKKEKEFSLEKNIAMFALYPKEKGIFNWYHENIIKSIESLKSFHRINRWIKEIWTEIGLTQNWYGKVWSIELANKNYKEFQKDVEYIEKVYFNIIKTK